MEVDIANSIALTAKEITGVARLQLLYEGMRQANPETKEPSLLSMD